MVARRILIALVVLMVLTAVTASLAPRDTALQQEQPAQAAPAVPTAEPVEATLDAASARQRVQARVGQNVVIVVRSDELDTVAIDEVGAEPTEPDSPARFELLADVPGSYPIVLLEAGRQIGVLEIRE